MSLSHKHIILNLPHKLLRLDAGVVILGKVLNTYIFRYNNFLQCSSNQANLFILYVLTPKTSEPQFWIILCNDILITIYS